MAGIKTGVDGQINNNIQTLGLVTYWDAAYKKSYVEGNPTTYSLASGSLTPTGSMVNDTSGSLGSPKAWEFDGVDSYINIGLAKPPSLNFTGDMSISTWINNEGSGLAGVVVDCNSGGSSLQFCIDINRTTNKITILSNTTSVITSTLTLSTSTWYNIVMTRAGSSGDWDYVLYINGLESNGGTANTAVNPAAQQGSAIGNFGNLGGSYKFNGKISNCLFYNKALSAGDVLQNYNAQKDRFGL